MAPNQEIVDENYAAFKKMLPGIMLQHAGRFALMHNAGIVDFFDTARDAAIAGDHLYGDGKFSVQEVTLVPRNFGRYSYA